MKPVPPLYVTQPAMPPLEEFIASLEAIWESKILTNGGPFHERLEGALVEYLGVGHVSLMNNGTIGLLVALQALRISGEVITTPYSFVATAHSLLWSGITPVFADVDPETLNLDPRCVEGAITQRTSAIMPVHCYGRPCDVDGIESLARRHGLKVIYDAAHAFGVRRGGTSILSHGDVSVLSFHATKVFNTFEGGAVVCASAALRKRIEQLRNFGFESEIVVPSLGINGKLSEVHAAFGLLQLKHLDAAIQRRGAIDRHYRLLLREVPGIRCLPPQEAGANYAYFPVLVRPELGIARDKLYEKLAEVGIHGRRYFFPLISDLPMYRGLPSAAPANLPIARAAADAVLCLPMSPNMELADAERVVTRIAEAAAAG